MDSYKVNILGKKYIPHFGGVFPLNKLPQALRAPSNFIVNTDTYSSPGEHWLAVSYQKGGIVYVFDPFGFYYPPLLKMYANKLRRVVPVIFNRIQYQGLVEQTCGLYCIAWLIAINTTGYKHTQGYKHS